MSIPESPEDALSYMLCTINMNTKVHTDWLRKARRPETHTQYITILMTRLHLLHTVVVSLHVHKIDVIIIIPEMVVSFDIWAGVNLCQQGFLLRMLPGPCHRGLINTRTIFTSSLDWESRRELMVRPTRFSTSVLYTPVVNKPLHSVASWWRPCYYGHILLIPLRASQLPTTTQRAFYANGNLPIR